MEIILEQPSLVTHWLIISWPTHVFIYFVILSCEFSSAFKSDGPFYWPDHWLSYGVFSWGGISNTLWILFLYKGKHLSKAASHRRVKAFASTLSRVLAIFIPLRKPDGSTCPWFMHNQSKQLRAVILICWLFSKEKYLALYARK